jgi:hypothetical protein
MDFGIITLVYIIIGVIFVLAKAFRTKSASWEKPLTANQIPEFSRIQPIPRFFTVPADFQRIMPIAKEAYGFIGSFNGR